MPTAHDGTKWWVRFGPALAFANVRRFLAGQVVSQVGLWMQATAEAWLILEVTGSGTALGIHSVLRFGPMLVLGVHGGLLSDRVDRLTLLKVTQSLHAIGTAMVVVAALMPVPSIGLIFVASAFKGCVNAVDNPLRRTFIRDIAPDHVLGNAVALGATLNNAAGVVGPAMAGLIIATVGPVWCFILNTASYGAVLIALQTLDRSQLRAREPARAGKGQVREGLRYAWGHRHIRTWLMVTAAVGTFAWSHAVVVPAYATMSLGGGATTYGYLMSTIAAGALVGAVVTARAVGKDHRRLLVAMTALTASMVGAAVAPYLAVAFASLFLLGAAGTSVLIATQTGIQLRAEEGLAGRVMALYSIGLTGSRPLGGALSGGLIDVSGPRMAFGVGAAALGAITLWQVVEAFRRRGTEPA